jgi:hypothetical protein
MSQSSSLSPAYLAKLRRNLTRLAESDLRNFCFDRGIDYDELPTKHGGSFGFAQDKLGNPPQAGLQYRDRWGIGSEGR